MASLLPRHEGLLPSWLLLCSLLALSNTVHNYRDKSHTLRTYEGPAATSQVTDLSARLFGTWTLLSCVVRLYAAYRIDVVEVYGLALWTFVIALFQFGSEWKVYGTMKMGKGLVPVLAVSVGTTCWMLTQWKFYVG